MKKLSTGQDSTLGNHLINTKIVFGEDNKAVEFLNKLIAEAPNGKDEEVLADEGQFVFLLAALVFGTKEILEVEAAR